MLLFDYLIDEYNIDIEQDDQKLIKDLMSGYDE